GDKVKQGQMLAQLDDRLARNDLETKQAKRAQAEAEYQAARAASTEAQNRLDRLKQLLARAAVAQAEYEAAVLTRDRDRQEEAAKKEGVRAAQLDLERAQTILDMHTIRSPVSGVVQRILKRPGEAVRRLETLFEIRVAEGQE